MANSDGFHLTPLDLAVARSIAESDVVVAELRRLRAVEAAAIVVADADKLGDERVLYDALSMLHATLDADRG